MLHRVLYSCQWPKQSPLPAVRIRFIFTHIPLGSCCEMSYPASTSGHNKRATLPTSVHRHEVRHNSRLCHRGWHERLWAAQYYTFLPQVLWQWPEQGLLSVHPKRPAVLWWDGKSKMYHITSLSCIYQCALIITIQHSSHSTHGNQTAPALQEKTRVKVAIRDFVQLAVQEKIREMFPRWSTSNSPLTLKERSAK